MTTTTTTLSPTKALAALSLDDGARPPETTANDDELERFRREWRQEVQGRKAGTAKPADDAPAVAVAVPATAVPADKPSRASLDRVRSRESAGSHKSPKQAPALGSSPTKLTLPTPRSPTKAAYAGIGLYAHHTVPAGPSRHVHTLGGTTASAKIPFRAPQVTKDKDAAVEVYARAVEREQSGQLNEALKLYRQAFKLDDNVDRLYARVAARQAAEVQEAAAAEVEEQLTSADVVDPSAPEEEPYDFTRHIQTAPDYEKAAKARLAGASRLSALFSALDEAHDTFLPEDEELPIPIAKLPAELLEPIFAHLDVATIERFALTCWRARALTAVAGKWKRLAEGIYRSPSMVPPGLAPRELARRHRGEWRTALVEEERIRMDGCYISVCHYIRPGAGEQWVAITHMITYHRFLRFYPDGQVISFLTTDHPSDVVPTLRPNLRGKGLHFGRWRLVRSDDPSNDDEGQAQGHAAPGRRKRARIVISELLEPGVDNPKYEFEMDLALRETGRGRWNKLDLSTYSSINLATGETLGLSLRHQKPFYFSKVKSYSPQF